MKNSILFILCFIFVGIIVYSDRCQAMGVPDQIVIPPSPVEPPQCLKVGDNNSLIFSTEKSSYVFELQPDPIAEKFVADHFSGIYQWTKTLGSSSSTADSDTVVQWHTILFSSDILPWRARRNAEPAELETPIGPPEKAIEFIYTLKEYRDWGGCILGFTADPAGKYCKIILREQDGYEEIKSNLFVTYHVQVVSGFDTLAFDKELPIIYRLTRRHHILEKTRNAENTGFHRAITYCDGMGRTIQKINIGSTPSGKDVVLPVYYDIYGRNSRTYLPYVTVGQGKYHANAFEAQEAYYTSLYGASPYAYSESRFNGAGQVVRSNIPGQAWQIEGEHTTYTVYRKNRVQDRIRRYVLEDNGLTCGGYYQEGELSVTEIIDPEGHVLLEYRNTEGLLIAKEVRDEGGESLFTYTVYDDFKRKRYILPPSRSAVFHQGTRYFSELQSDCYYIEYDSHGRVYKQHVPGGGYTLNLYDARGRLAFSQDARLREEGKWNFTKYDVFDRPVITGLCTGTEVELQEMLATQKDRNERRGMAMHGYTNQACPTRISPEDCFVIIYYDDYLWPDQEKVAWSDADALSEMRSDRVLGEVTGTKTKVLGDTIDQWLLKANYYSAKYLPIQVVSQLYPSGTEIVSNKHNFGGDVKQVKVKQIVCGLVTEYNKYFDYDNQERLLQVRQKITGDTVNNEVVVASYVYDDLGRTQKMNLHNDKESIDYSYHLAGMLSTVTNPHFSYALDYEQKVIPEAIARYDGNINAIRWKRGDEPSKAYLYYYDPLNRLASASFREKNASTWINHSGAYNVTGLTYDMNSNLLSLKRQANNGAVLNDLVYSYTFSGNKNAVTCITDQGNTSAIYEYDELGNMTSDGRRGINISYNLLNLPECITKSSDNISYFYSASGEKLAQKVGSSLTYYRGVMIYEGSNISYLLHPEGFVRKNDRGYAYHYLLKDYLGNTRVLLEAFNDNLVAIQHTDYYPFGVTFENNELHRNKYLFSGKELQDKVFNGRMLSLYDFGSRYYDPELGRWLNIDPALQLVSPYGYCGNNPIRYIDPDGEFFWIPLAIGAVLGAWSGGTLANDGQLNPVKWDWQSGKTWKYMAGGAAIGGLSAYGAAGITSISSMMPNLMGTIAGSFYSSIGMAAMSGGRVSPNINFGLASVDLGSGEWNYLGKKGNKWYEDLSYGVAAFGNLSDLWSIYKGSYNSTSHVELQTDGHSQIYNPEDGKTFSWGAYAENGDYIEHTIPNFFKEHKPTTNYTNSKVGPFERSVRINKINLEGYNSYINSVPKAGQMYRMGLLFPIKNMHCAIAASRALLNGGVFNLPVLRIPLLLDMQMRIRDYVYISYSLKNLKL